MLLSKRRIKINKGLRNKITQDELDQNLSKELTLDWQSVFFTVLSLEDSSRALTSTKCQRDGSMVSRVNRSRERCENISIYRF